MCQGKIQYECTRRWKSICQVPGSLQDDVVPYFHITPFLVRSRRNLVDLNPMTHRTQNTTKSVHHPVVYLRILRLSFTRLQVISEIVDVKSITRTLPKRPNQIRYWYPKLRAKPDLPKCKRESIVIGTTLDVAEEPQRLPSQGAGRGVTRL